MAYVKCRRCKYCEKDDISSTRSKFREGDDTRCWCTLDDKMVKDHDGCSRGKDVDDDDD